MVSSAVAQSPAYTSFKLAPNPQVSSISGDNARYPAVIVQDMKMIEIIGGLTPVMYYTEHKIVHVNSSAGIEKYNKVALPVSDPTSLVSLSVRSIDPTGKVTDFSEKDLKELENPNGYHNYKIFAIEGLTAGGELEYLYTIRSSPRLFGREILQAEVPVLEAGVIVIYPKTVEFRGKAYNGGVETDLSTYDQQRNSLVADAKNVPALENEDYSAYNADLLRFDYRLT